MFDTLWQDLRHAARLLRRAPGFTLTAVVTLALGIGATTALFSVVDGVLLNPLPFPAADRLVSVFGTNARLDRDSLSYPNFLDWRDAARSFEALAARRTDTFTLTGRGTPEVLFGMMVSADFFRVLGVEPVAGRAFRADEDRLGASPVAMLGEEIWRRRFGADPGILGTTLTLDGRPHTVVGIAPSSVRFERVGRAFVNDVLTPIGQYGDPLFHRRGVVNGTQAIGRLAPGVTLAQARTELGAIAARLAGTYPRESGTVGANVVPMVDVVVGSRRASILALLGAVGLVLLIAFANVASLMLARASARQGEIVTRAALGAGRGRLLLGVLAEALFVSVAGGLLGTVLAAVGTRATLDVLPSALPVIADVRVSVRALVVASGLSIGVALGLALVTGLRAVRGDTHTALAAGGRRVQGAPLRPQRLLVVSQVALTFVLLIGAGLMVRSLARVFEVDPGVDANGLHTFRTALSPSRATSAADVRRVLSELETTVASVPGVEAASIDIGSPPFESGSTSMGFRRADEVPSPDDRTDREALFHAVGPRYFEAMGIRLVRGRAFASTDDADHPAVLIVDEELARTEFPGRDPIGQRIVMGGFDTAFEIVGVVAHVKHWGLDRDDTASVRSQFYIPVAQLPDPIAALAATAVGVAIRSQVPSAPPFAAIREAVARFDPTQALFAERSMASVITASQAGRRFLMLLLAVFAGAALVLSVVGLYGVVAYVVGRRTAEVGLRMALGARPVDVIRLIVGEGQRLTLAGLVIGVGLAWWLTRLLASELYGVTATDPTTLAAVTAVLAASTFGACYVPARRAAAVDPAEALRAE